MPANPSPDDAQTIAALLLDIGAVGFAPDAPVTFKSGIRSPMYIDNRRLPYHPAAWRQVIAAFVRLIDRQNLACDVIAGIATAGIPHSAVLAYTLEKPSIFIRKAAKGHGTQQRIEGGDVQGRRVLLVEDLVTTGGSSLSGVDVLRQAGATVQGCLAIASYGFQEATDNFAAAGVTLHILTGFPAIRQVALEQGLLSPEARQAVDAWHADPHNWEQQTS